MFVDMFGDVGTDWLKWNKSMTTYIPVQANDWCAWYLCNLEVL